MRSKIWFKTWHRALRWSSYYLVWFLLSGLQKLEHWSYSRCNRLLNPQTESWRRHGKSGSKRRISTYITAVGGIEGRPSLKKWKVCQCEAIGKAKYTSYHSLRFFNIILSHWISDFSDPFLLRIIDFFFSYFSSMIIISTCYLPPCFNKLFLVKVRKPSSTSLYIYFVAWMES